MLVAGLISWGTSKFFFWRYVFCFHLTKYWFWFAFLITFKVREIGARTIKFFFVFFLEIKGSPLRLWKNRFFGSWAVFGCSQPLGRLIFCISDTYAIGQKIFKKCGMKKIFWKIFRKTSKLSRNIFWACWDHIVAQKSLASKKKCQKLLNTGTPPCLPNCVISVVACRDICVKIGGFRRGGGSKSPKMTKKWYFLTSVTKRVLGSIKRLLEYDIEYYRTPSGNYGLVPTCPQHTSRGGVKKNFFSTNFCRFYAKIKIFWTMFWTTAHYRWQNSSKISQILFLRVY